MPAVPGGLVIYTLTASNAEPSDAANVTLKDTLPTQLAGQEYSADNGRTWNEWKGSFTLDQPNAGTACTLLLRGLLAIQNLGAKELINTVFIDSDTPDPDPDNNTMILITPVKATADLTIRKTASPSPVSPGEAITYDISVNNLGPDEAENVLITDAAILSELENPLYSTDGGATWSKWSGSFSIGTLQPGSTFTVLQIRGTVPEGRAAVLNTAAPLQIRHSPYQTADLAAGSSIVILIRGTLSKTASDTLTNTAAATSSTPDPDHSNNSGYSNINIGNVPSADLAVTKKAHCQTVCPGRFVEYCITVTNLGPDMAKDVLMTDLLPTTILEPRYSLNNDHTWQPWTGQLTIGSLADSASVTLFLSGKIDCCAHGTITNTVTVSGSVQDPNPDNNSADAAVTVCSN